MLFDTLFCFSIPTLVSDGTQKKNVPWHILAPRRGCFSNHLPLRRVRILVERLLSYGNEVSYTIIKPEEAYYLLPALL